MKGLLFGILVVFVILFDELFHAEANLLGLDVESGIKQYEAVVLALVAYYLMIRSFAKGQVDPHTMRVLAFMAVILLLYCLTPLFYGKDDGKYTSYLLVYGAECIPAAFVGTLLAKRDDLLIINKILPFFLIPSVLIIGTLGLATALMGAVIASNAEDSGGLHYQNISYFMAFAFSYFCYLLFFSNAHHKHRNGYVRFMYLFFIVFCVLVCLMSGGRGGFVLIVFDAVFLLYLYNPNNSKGRIRVYMFLIFASILIYFLLSYFDVLNTAGMQRVLLNLTEDSSREDLYQNAFDAFLSSPIIGNGAGSIWWIVGFYSHNIILDWLAEVGLLGTLLFVVLLIRTFWELMKKVKIEPAFVLYLMIFVNNIVFYSFSGYWVGAMKLFFICAFVFCLRHRDTEREYKKIPL